MKNFYVLLYFLNFRRFEPSDILKSIKDVKMKIKVNDIEEKIMPILDKVANYAIDPDELAKVKKIDDRISAIDINLIKNLNKIKK